VTGKASAAGLTISRESRRAAVRLRREIPEVWIGATEERLREILPRHAGRDGFRFFAARDGKRLVGIAYGYLGAPGQWWHDIVSKAMTREQRRRWIAPGHFEVVELHVHPEYRRRGIGARLHDTLLARLESRTAVLSTQTDNRPALGLYQGRGWQIIVPSLRFAPAGEEYAILGLDLEARGD
jgi:ribosomal protein S18 acetylase RimI-like enzyme